MSHSLPLGSIWTSFASLTNPFLEGSLELAIASSPLLLCLASQAQLDWLHQEMAMISPRGGAVENESLVLLPSPTADAPTAIDGATANPQQLPHIEAWGTATQEVTAEDGTPHTPRIGSEAADSQGGGQEGRGTPLLPSTSEVSLHGGEASHSARGERWSHQFAKEDLVCYLPEDTTCRPPDDAKTRSPDATKSLSRDDIKSLSPDDINVPSPDDRTTPSPDDTNTRLLDDTKSLSHDVIPIPSPDDTKTPSPDLTKSLSPAKTRSPDETKSLSPDDNRVRSPDDATTRSPKNTAGRSPDATMTGSSDDASTRSCDETSSHSLFTSSTRSDQSTAQPVGVERTDGCECECGRNTVRSLRGGRGEKTGRSSRRNRSSRQSSSGVSGSLALGKKGYLSAAGSDRKEGSIMTRPSSPKSAQPSRRAVRSEARTHANMETHPAVSPSTRRRHTKQKSTRSTTEAPSTPKGVLNMLPKLSLDAELSAPSESAETAVSVRPQLQITFTLELPSLQTVWRRIVNSPEQADEEEREDKLPQEVASIPQLLKVAAAWDAQCVVSDSGACESARENKRNKLLHAGLQANREGRTADACQLLHAAALIRPTPSALLSVANMRLKLVSQIELSLQLFFQSTRLRCMCHSFTGPARACAACVRICESIIFCKLEGAVNGTEQTRNCAS